MAHTASVRPGRDVQVLDLSRGGALIEGRARFVPNSIVQLRLNGGGLALDLRGRVVRCYVSGLDGGTVSYRAGVAFDAQVDLSEFEWGEAQKVSPK
jgi:hypothetical protein